jgi:hypothetical protein
MDNTDVVGWHSGARVGTRSRAAWTAVLTAVLAVAVLTAGCGTTAATAGGHKQSPTGARSPARDAASAAPANGSAVLGRAYPFKLFIHCGVPVVGFGGRSWKPVAPVPEYPGPRPVNGVATYTGYVVGTMTLTDAGTLRFVADNRAVLAPFAVVYKPLTTPVTRQPCA